MFSAISAEALKLVRHTATWSLVWIYPLAVFAMFVLAISIDLSGAEQMESMAALTSDKWIGDTLVIWHFPSHPVGRYMISAFVAVVFAGEYGWNTWKLILPHRARSSILLAKYVLIVILFSAAYSLTAAVTVLMTLLEDALTGDTIPEGLTMGLLLGAHRDAALAAVAPALLTISYTSLAAVLTRSTIAALVVGIGIATVEFVFVEFGAKLAVYALDAVLFLYQTLPGYHLVNLTSWITESTALREGFPDGTDIALHWTVSVAAASGWVIGLGVLTLFIFNRQDID